MKSMALFTIALVLAAMPAAAMAEGVYYLRNDTSRSFDCALRRERGSAVDRFQLRPGRDWSQTMAGDGARTLLCDIGQIVPHYRMQAGVRYALVEYKGAVSMRVVGP